MPISSPSLTFAPRAFPCLLAHASAHALFLTQAKVQEAGESRKDATTLAAYCEDLTTREAKLKVALQQAEVTLCVLAELFSQVCKIVRHEE